MKFVNIILLLTCVIVFTLPNILSLQYSFLQNQYQNSVQERLSGTEAIHITLAKKDIHWIKKGKEILYKGKYFDTKQVIENDDSLQIIGWYDEAETVTAINYEKIKTKKKAAFKFLLQQLLVHYISPQTNTIETLFGNETDNKFNNYFGCQLNRYYCSINKPPENFS